MKSLQIRLMHKSDWSFVKSIYESGIATGFSTFEIAAPHWLEWDKNHLEFGRLVGVISNKVVGWAALSPVSGRCVYAGVAEVSIYVEKDYRGMGIGKKLLQGLILNSEENGIWTLQAGIFSNNIASIELHKSVGFRVIGYRERIGKLKGKWHNNTILERRSVLVGIQ